MGSKSKSLFFFTNLHQTIYTERAKCFILFIRIYVKNIFFFSSSSKVLQNLYYVHINIPKNQLNILFIEIFNTAFQMYVLCIILC